MATTRRAGPESFPLAIASASSNGDQTHVTKGSFAWDLYSLGALRYAHDLFSGFDYQASGAGGIGYKFFNTDSTKLSAQAGVGYQIVRPEEITKNGDGEVTTPSRLPA